jgi:hypothetical protein
MRVIPIRPAKGALNAGERMDHLASARLREVDHQLGSCREEPVGAQECAIRRDFLDLAGKRK